MSHQSEKRQQGGAATEEREETRHPALYKVLLHNDDYTTMDFVVLVLEHVFHKEPEEANRIMMSVHQQGRGVAGIFPLDVAETKVVLVHNLARKHEYPLKCSLEQA